MAESGDAFGKRKGPRTAALILEPGVFFYMLGLGGAGKKVEQRHIQAGKPSQNGIIERLNGTLRKECLNLEWFGGLAQLNEHIQEWSVIYNTKRPHSSIGYQTPEGFEMKQKELYSNVLAL